MAEIQEKVENSKDESYSTEIGGGNTYTDFFLPLVLSMSTNNPLQFWKLRYNQEREAFLSSKSIEEQMNALFVWFGIDCLTNSIGVIKNLPLDSNSKILDLGCGNGHFCEALASNGFKKVYGTDFCDTALDIAHQLRNLYKQPSETESPITYVLDDILDSNFEDNWFDLIFDKGTLDSVGMVSSGFIEGEEEEVHARSLESQWGSEVNRILKPGKYLIVISCNHSKEEISQILQIEQHMQLIQDESDKYDGVQYLVFQKPSSFVGS